MNITQEESIKIVLKGELKVGEEIIGNIEGTVSNYNYDNCNVGIVINNGMKKKFCDNDAALKADISTFIESVIAKQKELLGGTK